MANGNESNITHRQALDAAFALIDHYFHNQTGRRVKVCIPRELDDTDVVLVGYIRQQGELIPALVQAVCELSYFVRDYLGTNPNAHAALEKADAVIAKILGEAMPILEHAGAAEEVQP